MDPDTWARRAPWEAFLEEINPRESLVDEFACDAYFEPRFVVTLTFGWTDDGTEILELRDRIRRFEMQGVDAVLGGVTFHALGWPVTGLDASVAMPEWIADTAWPNPFSALALPDSVTLTPSFPAGIDLDDLG